MRVSMRATFLTSLTARTDGHQSHMTAMVTTGHNPDEADETDETTTGQATGVVIRVVAVVVTGTHHMAPEAAVVADIVEIEVVVVAAGDEEGAVVSHSTGVWMMLVTMVMVGAVTITRTPSISTEGVRIGDH